MNLPAQWSDRNKEMAKNIINGRDAVVPEGMQYTQVCSILAWQGPRTGRTLLVSAFMCADNG